MILSYIFIHSFIVTVLHVFRKILRIVSNILPNISNLLNISNSLSWVHTNSTQSSHQNIFFFRLLCLLSYYHGQSNRPYLQKSQRSWPYPPPNTIFFYHNNLSLLLKTNTLVLVMPLGVHILYHLLYKIKALAIMLIITSMIMTIHINLKHKGTNHSYSCFDDTITTVTTPSLSKFPPPGK